MMPMTDSTLASLGCEDYIRNQVESGVSHNLIAAELQQLHPGVRGLSLRSVRRYCSERGIHYSSRLSSSQVEQCVEQSVSQVSKM